MLRTHGSLLTITLMLLVIVPASAAELDDGFLGIRWGADLRQLEGFSLLYAKNDLRFYVKPDTVREIQGFPIPRVVYGTYQNRFFAAYLDIDSPETFTGIKDYMQDRYGFPKTSWSVGADRTTHKWKYNRIRIKLKRSESENRMKLAFYYTPISSQANEDLSEREHQESRRFLPIDRHKKPEALPLLIF